MHLNSLDVSGLQIGQQLSGCTLVQYAGSLTSRDFHIIAQVAPYVLYDLVPVVCFDAWVSLSNLVPLLWQPAIEDIDKYIVSTSGSWCLMSHNADFQACLETTITEFLYRVICWTPCWFNKPKFHFILHLPAHIRRFGPAVLFATETFESYNAIIRGKSVHSNHLAPSRDVALAFAHYSRVWHLLSSGRHFFRESKQSQKYLQAFGLSHSNLGNVLSNYVGNASIWRQVSSTTPHMQIILNEHSSASSYVGPLVSLNPRLGKFNPFLSKQRYSWFRGTCVLDKRAPPPYDHTEMAQHFPIFPSSLSSTLHVAYCTAASVMLFNGDVCRIL